MANPVIETARARRLFWTAYSPPEGDSEPTDPLAFDMYAERLGNLIVPGVTSRTVRLRYLGMVCAGLRLTGRSVSGASARNIVRERRKAFLPFERGWAFAMTLGAEGRIKESLPGSGRASLRARYRGFRGANLALANYRRTQSEPLVHPFNYRFLAAAGSQGGLGAYLVTLDYGGFVDRSTLTLRGPGHALADAFLGSAAGKAARLVTNQKVRRGDLAAAGQAFDLGAASREERNLVRLGLFADQRTLAEACRLVGNTSAGSTAEEALRAVARHNGESLERAAQFALDFEPVRQLGLTTFARLGERLPALNGPATFKQVAASVAEPAQQLREAAQRLALRIPPPSLVPLGVLAQHLANASNEPEVLSVLLRWHGAHRNPWIAEVLPETYESRRHGVFREPTTFHGYTMDSALSLLAEVERKPT
jgi:hypothetical protein